MKTLLIETPYHSFEVEAADDVDMDSAFKATCLETGDSLTIYGWICDITVQKEDVEVYRGCRIVKEEDGYAANNGICNHFGYTDTLEEIRAEIDDHFAEGDDGPPLDTPSLDTSFHDHEMKGAE